MASRRPKDVSAWLGGNRGTVQSGGGKPMGIVDDIAKGIKDIASPWLPAAPGQNKSVTQAQGLARATAETLDQTVTGGLVKAGTQGNQALAKQAAINAAALGTGYVAGKAVQTVVPVITKTGIKTIQSFANNAPKTHIVEEFPRLNKKQLRLLNAVQNSGPDRTRSIHESVITKDISGVVDNYSKFNKLKYEDVSAVANRLKLQTAKNLERAGYGNNVTVYRTDYKGFETNPTQNNPNWAVSTTVKRGGLPSFAAKPNSTTNAYKVRRSDILSEYVTNPNAIGNQYPDEKELLIFRKDLKPKKR
jgi:hypothetical protein